MNYNTFVFMLAVSTIKTVYTIEQIKSLMSVKSDVGGTEYGIVYAVFTTLDLDRDERSGVSSRWYVLLIVYLSLQCCDCSPYFPSPKYLKPDYYKFIT